MTSIDALIASAHKSKYGTEGHPPQAAMVLTFATGTLPPAASGGRVHVATALPLEPMPRGGAALAAWEDPLARYLAGTGLGFGGGLALALAGAHFVSGLAIFGVRAAPTAVARTLATLEKDHFREATATQ